MSRPTILVNGHRPPPLGTAADGEVAIGTTAALTLESTNGITSVVWDFEKVPVGSTAAPTPTTGLNAEATFDLAGEYILTCRSQSGRRDRVVLRVYTAAHDLLITQPDDPAATLHEAVNRTTRAVDTIVATASQTQHVPNTTALRQVAAEANAGVILAGHTTRGDGGGGLFFFDPSDTSSPDDGATTIVSSGGQRFKRLFSGFVDVRWFGARGNGFVNDSPAFTAACAYVRARGGGVVYAPAGRYLLATRVSKPGGVTIRGDGIGVTVLVSNGLYPMIDSLEVNTGSGVTRRSFEGGISDLTLDAQDPGGTGGGYLIYADGWYRQTLRRVGFANAAGGLHIRGDIGGVYGGYYGSLYDCTFDSLGVGARFSYGGNEWKIFGGRFNSCGTCILLSGATGTKVFGSSLESSTIGVQLGQANDDNDGTPTGTLLDGLRVEGLTSGFKFVREVGTYIRSTNNVGAIGTLYDESGRQDSGTGSVRGYTILDDVNFTLSGGTSIRTVLQKRVQLAFGNVGANGYVDKQIILDGMVEQDHVTLSVEGRAALLNAVPAAIDFSIVDKDAGVLYVRAKNRTGSTVDAGTRYVTVVAWRFN